MNRFSCLIRVPIHFQFEGQVTDRAGQFRGLSGLHNRKRYTSFLGKSKSKVHSEDRRMPERSRRRLGSSREEVAGNQKGETKLESRPETQRARSRAVVCCRQHQEEDPTDPGEGKKAKKKRTQVLPNQMNHRRAWREFEPLEGRLS